MRKFIVAGQFYSSDKGELIDDVRKFLGKEKKEDVKAVIVPHAGYVFSGKLAGKVIGKIKEKKTFIILGVNHSGLGSRISFSFEDFSTPLGIVKNNKQLGEKILSKLRLLGYANVNETAHSHEHSIEVILPFLQLSQKNFDIVPIILKDMTDVACERTAYILSKFLTGEVCVIVSSDFTHYGTGYGFLPFTYNVRENLYKLDRGIIDEILSLNAKKVYEKARKSTVCGIYGVTVLTELARIMKWKSKLVDYYTSGDVSGDFSNCVGYAGIIFQ
ncbi:MAG: AmmeMemoRadiSam system protein B [Nanoarchaeota archaeon]